MEKKLSQRMAEYAVKKNKSNARFNLAMFLLLRDEINEAIDDGWSVKYVWEVLSEEGKITFSYQTFLNFVNKYKSESSTQSKKIIAKKESAALTESEPMAELQPESEPAAESESSEDRIKVTQSSEYPATGNPKGFEWSTDYDPKDFI